MWKGEGKHKGKHIVCFVFGGELLCHGILVLEIKWKFVGGGSDGVSVLGGALRNRRENGAV